MMKKGFCRFAALCLCLVLCLSAVTPVFAATHITKSSQINGFTYSAAYGEKLNEIFQGKAKMFSNSSDTYSLGQNINMNRQYAVAKVISGQQCYIYAQAVYHYLFGDVPYHGTGIGDYWNNSKRVLHNVTSVSRQSFINAGVGFGAYIRTTVNSNGSFSGSYGHSMILLSYDAAGLTYLDCNGDGKGAIRVTTRTWSEFNRVLLSSKGRRIAHVVQPQNVLSGPAADLGTGFTATIQPLNLRAFLDDELTADHEGITFIGEIVPGDNRLIHIGFSSPISGASVIHQTPRMHQSFWLNQLVCRLA